MPMGELLLLVEIPIVGLLYTIRQLMPGQTAG